MQSDLFFQKCTKLRQCSNTDCSSTQNAPFHGSERVYSANDSTKFHAVGKNPSHFASLDVKTVEDAGAIFVLRAIDLLQIVELKLSNNKISSNTVVLCDSVCSLSRVPAQT